MLISPFDLHVIWHPLQDSWQCCTLFFKLRCLLIESLSALLRCDWSSLLSVYKYLGCDIITSDFWVSVHINTQPWTWTAELHQQILGPVPQKAPFSCQYALSYTVSVVAGGIRCVFNVCFTCPIVSAVSLSLISAWTMSLIQTMSRRRKQVQYWYCCHDWLIDSFTGYSQQT